MIPKALKLMDLCAIEHEIDSVIHVHVSITSQSNVLE